MRSMTDICVCGNTEFILNEDTLMLECECCGAPLRKIKLTDTVITDEGKFSAKEII